MACVSVGDVGVTGPLKSVVVKTQVRVIRQGWSQKETKHRSIGWLSRNHSQKNDPRSVQEQICRVAKVAGGLKGKPNQ